MPKCRKYVKRDSDIIEVSLPHKNRIGGRKSMKTAHQCSTAELLAMRDNPDYSRARNKINTTLLLRGIM